MDQNLMQNNADLEALKFYLDCGINEIIEDEAIDRFKLQAQTIDSVAAPPMEAAVESAAQTKSAVTSSLPDISAPAVPLGKSESYKIAVEAAKACVDLNALQEALQNFDGLPIKNTASNLVFADGNAESKIMLIGEAPESEDDRSGKAFSGPSGALLDKILGSIGLSRSSENLAHSVYLSNLLNWRPPGGRSASPAEIDVSLPFLERHIQLAQPEILILCGGTLAKALLGTNESLTKLRRKGWHEYQVQTAELKSDHSKAIKTLVTYHPSYLINTPMQKRAVWADMLNLKHALKNP